MAITQEIEKEKVLKLFFMITVIFGYGGLRNITEYVGPLFVI